MFDHIGAAMLAPLGHVPGASDKAGGGCHLALKAADREAVDAFHKAGLAAGAKDNGRPDQRTDYGSDLLCGFSSRPRRQQHRSGLHALGNPWKRRQKLGPRLRRGDFLQLPADESLVSARCGILGA